MKNIDWFGRFFIAFVLAIILGCIGWVMNIISLVTFEGTVSEFTMIEIIRVVGIFLAPLGAVMGWF